MSRLVFDNDQESLNYGLVFSSKDFQAHCNVEDTPDAAGKGSDLVVILVEFLILNHIEDNALSRCKLI